MSDSRICTKCNQPLPANAPAGICPRCLLNAGFATESLTAGFVPPDPTELAQHFPEFEIVSLLGKGGMGAVYKAHQNRLDRVVAVKVLPPEISHDPAFAERFTREARTLARLNHPNIVQIYDFGQSGPYFYFVMEFIDGVNLRQLIADGELKSGEALAIVPDICSALQFAHDTGVVHRDIKPENILINQHGHVKIADFGLAMLLDRESADVTLTGTNQVMGTPHYMAPEQMRGSNPIDHRADIYSLGVVFYELLTGELPLGRFEPPSKKVQIDVRIDEVVLRSLESTPDRRYQHASDVKTGIESIVRNGDRVFSAPQLAPSKPPSPEFISTVRRQLKIPRLGILISGIVNLLAACSAILLPILVNAWGGFYSGAIAVEGEATFGEAMFVGIIIALCSLGSGILMLVGYARMTDLQSWRISLSAAWISVLPIALGFIISLPCGIWALIILLRRDVRHAFADESEMVQSTGQTNAVVARARRSVVGESMTFGIVFGVSAGVIFDNIALFLPFGIVFGLIIGVIIDSNKNGDSLGE